MMALTSVASLGCWEQWSNEWWPQMKYQRSVRDFEGVERDGKLAPFVRPDGTVPVDGGEAPVSNVIDAESDVLQNPRPVTLASVENGRVQFGVFCAPCHGPDGRGDGPVSMTGSLAGPFAAVLPVAGPGSIARVRSDGHVYTTIRYGRRRMPGYARIPSEERWDIVNYLRYLNGQAEIGP